MTNHSTETSRPVEPDNAHQTTPTPCPDCGHDHHGIGDECDVMIEHGPSTMHRCLCLHLVGAGAACPPQMTCQGGTLGYADIWHLQRGHSLSGIDGAIITPDVLRVWPAVPAARPDTLPEWLCARYSRYQPGMLPWAQLGDGDRDYWAHEAAAVRRAVVRGGFRIDPTEQLPDGTPLSWEQRARKAEYTIERMKRTNRMVNGGARDARERAEAAEVGTETARRVADYWRQAMFDQGNAAAAHALAMVGAALDGERDPRELGMPTVDAGPADAGSAV